MPEYVCLCECVYHVRLCMLARTRVCVCFVVLLWDDWAVYWQSLGSSPVPEEWLLATGSAVITGAWPDSASWQQFLKGNILGYYFFSVWLAQRPERNSPPITGCWDSLAGRDFRTNRKKDFTTTALIHLQPIDTLTSYNNKTMIG